MNYKIFQLDRNNINVMYDRRMFTPWEVLNQTCGFSKHCYKKVYEGEVEEKDDLVKTLDYLFTKFNIAHPDDFRGHSLSVSDVVELDGVWYYCDSYGWVNVETEKLI